jgi:hypothetical protein
VRKAVASGIIGCIIQRTLSCHKKRAIIYMISRDFPMEGSGRAALSSKKHGGHVDAVCEAIQPAIKKAKTDSVDEVVKANVRMTVDR